MINRGELGNHIIPVNRVWNTKGFDAALNTDPSFLNSSDNLIFLDNASIHNGSHPNYDEAINLIINDKNMRQVKEEIEKVKERMKTNLIGTRTDINNYTP